MSKSSEEPWFIKSAATLRALPNEWDDRRGQEFDRLSSDERAAVQRKRVDCLSRAAKLLISAILDHGWLPGDRFLDLVDKAHWARNNERTRPYRRSAITFLGMFVRQCCEHARHLPPGMPTLSPVNLHDSGTRPEDVFRDDFERTCEAIAWLLEATAGPGSGAAQRLDVEGTDAPDEGEWSAPMTRTDMARRITGDRYARPRKVEKLLHRYGLRHVDGRMFQVRVDTMDSATRKKVEKPG
jgi:hypothetical protein